MPEISQINAPSHNVLFLLNDRYLYLTFVFRDQSGIHAVQQLFLNFGNYKGFKTIKYLCVISSSSQASSALIKMKIPVRMVTVLRICLNSISEYFSSLSVYMFFALLCAENSMNFLMSYMYSHTGYLSN